MKNQDDEDFFVAIHKAFQVCNRRSLLDALDTPQWAGRHFAEREAL